MGNNRQNFLRLEPGTQFQGQKDEGRSVGTSEAQWPVREGGNQKTLVSQKSRKKIARTLGDIKFIGGLENSSRSESLTRMGGKEREMVSLDSFHSLSLLGKRETG